MNRIPYSFPGSAYSTCRVRVNPAHSVSRVIRCCVWQVADFGLARSLRALKQGEESASVLTDYVATRW